MVLCKKLLVYNTLGILLSNIMKFNIIMSYNCIKIEFNCRIMFRHQPLQKQKNKQKIVAFWSFQRILSKESYVKLRRSCN